MDTAANKNFEQSEGQNLLLFNPTAEKGISQFT